MTNTEESKDWLRKRIGGSASCVHAISDGVLGGTFGKPEHVKLGGRTDVSLGSQARIDLKAMNETCHDFGNSVAKFFVKEGAGGKEERISDTQFEKHDSARLIW